VTGYRCNTCQWLGTELGVRRERDKVDERAAFMVTFKVCPACQTEEDFTEVNLCIDCSENGVETPATHDDWCRECAALNDWDFSGEEFKRDQIPPVQPLIRE
jgi:hypothetical protein